jgi:hypothetical protein
LPKDPNELKIVEKHYEALIKALGELYTMVTDA